MATEPDLSALLPPSPPPRPDRREASIATAMRRFDGETTVAPPPTSKPRRGLLGLPQFGVLAAAALVAVIGLPLWLAGENRSPSPTHEVATSRPVELPASADLAAEPLADAAASRAPGIVASPTAPADTSVPQALPPPPAERRLGEVAADMAAAPPLTALAPAPPPPPPPAPALAAAEEANVAGDIVVTGSRVMGRAAKAQQRLEQRSAKPGDWNACTVDDPRQDLAACRKTAAGAPGQAAALVGDGLTRAWQDDNDGAIAAFDRALAASPKSAAAWLNRGLAHARDGDDTGALADLDKAVRYAPNDPRGWFQRSLILRRLGKTAQADADAGRAAELDARYNHLVE